MMRRLRMTLAEDDDTGATSTQKGRSEGGYQRRLQRLPV